MPDLFAGDPVSTALVEGPALDLVAWRERHPTFAIDRIVDSTIKYIREQYGVSRLGAVGYCLGGKHVPRAMVAGAGIDVGFIAHPANLTGDEIKGIAGPISIAAGGELIPVLSSNAHCMQLYIVCTCFIRVYADTK
jgi:dienelactone hydrolase